MREGMRLLEDIGGGAYRLQAMATPSKKLNCSQLFPQSARQDGSTVNCFEGLLLTNSGCVAIEATKSWTSVASIISG